MPGGPTREPARRRQSSLAQRYPQDPRRERRHLRLTAGPCRAAPWRPADWPLADRAADAVRRIARPGGPAAANPNHRQPARLPDRPNRLDRNFVASRPGQVWLADLTCIPTGQGWLYLAAVLDLHTRKIVGWSMRERLYTEIALEALNMAIERQRPAPGLIHHSDRGIQYAAEAYRLALSRYGITPSMRGKGNCLDNAPMESFFHTPQNRAGSPPGLRHPGRSPPRSVPYYIEGFYNPHRLHSALGYTSPARGRENGSLNPSTFSGEDQADGVINRSPMSEIPHSPVAFYEVAHLFGTLIAETILAGVPVRAHKHGRKRSDQSTARHLARRGPSTYGECGLI